MKILIAEDESDIARSYKLALEERGHSVVLTSDGEDCLIKYHDEWLRTRHDQDSDQIGIETTYDINNDHPFHAIILDYKMPKMNGLEVAKQILAINPHQRIIFASAYVKETLEISTRHLPTELMQKPFDEQALIDKVEDANIYSELKKLGVDADALKAVNPPHETIKQLLDSIRRLKENLELRNDDDLFQERNNA
ncbi:MAG TPA: response regulator [Nitrososphaera sp.]|jgi:CheY-like chemotaxis protein